MYPLVRTRALSGYVFLGRDIFKCLNEYLVNVGGKKTTRKSPLMLPDNPCVCFLKEHTGFLLPLISGSYIRVSLLCELSQASVCQLCIA